MSCQNCDPARLDTCLSETLVDTRLMGAEGGAAPQHQRDGLEGRTKPRSGGGVIDIVRHAYRRNKAKAKPRPMLRRAIR
jgi:hypothetical protein